MEKERAEALAKAKSISGQPSTSYPTDAGSSQKPDVEAASPGQTAKTRFFADVVVDSLRFFSGC